MENRFDFSVLVSLVKKRLVYLILLCAAIFLGTFFYCYYFVDNTYTLSASILIINNQEAGGTVDAQYQKSVTTESIANNCEVMLKSSDLVQQAIKQAGVSYQTETTLANLTLKRIGDSHILTYTFKTANPDAGVKFLNALAQTACNEAQRLFTVPPVSASIAEKAVRPPLKSNLLPGLLNGLGFALIAAVLFLLLQVIVLIIDPTVRNLGRVSKATGKKILCAVPDHERGESPTSASNMARTKNSYRTLRSAVKYSPEPVRSIAVCSPMPKDGRTSVAVGLACALAESTDARVILIEADLRRPHIKAELKIDASEGLADVLLNKAGITKALSRTAMRNLFALTSSSYQTASSVNPSDILDSDSMKDLLDALYEQFDYIIIDTPATLLVPDATCIAGKVDACLMVLQYGHTSMDALKTSINTLENTGAHILGIAATAMPAQDMNNAMVNYYTK